MSKFYLKDHFWGRFVLAYDDLRHTRYRPVAADSLHEIDWRYNKFRSIFTYTREELAAWTSPKKLLSGQPSLAGMPAESPYWAPTFVIDIDSDSLMEGASAARALANFYEIMTAPYHLFFSGKKGFHVEIPAYAIGYTPSEDLAEIMGDFAGRIADLVGIRDVCDLGIYHRHHKIRVPNCGRDDGARKIYLPDKKYLRAWARLHAFSKRGPQPVPQFDSGVRGPRSGLLSKIWEEAASFVRGLPPVTILRGGSKGGSYNKGTGSSYDEGDIQALKNRLSAQHGSSHDPSGKIIIRCPNPAHDDRTPSAVLWPTGWVWCSSCHENFSPDRVGSWVGVSVSRKAAPEPEPDPVEPEEGQDQDGPMDLATARRVIEEKFHDLMKARKSFVAKIPVGAGKSHAVREALKSLDLSAVYTAPTHEMLAEAADAYAGIHLRPYYEIEPRYVETPFPADQSMLTPEARKRRGLPPVYAPDPQTGEAVYQSITFYDEVQYRMEELGLSKRPAMALAPWHPQNPDRDKSLAPCAYEAVLDAIVEGDWRYVQGVGGLATGVQEKVFDTVYAASAHLGLTTMGSMVAGRDYVIVDEDACEWLAPVETFRVSDLKILLSDQICGEKFIYVDPPEERAAIEKWFREEGRPVPDHDKIPLKELFGRILSGEWDELGLWRRDRIGPPSKDDFRMLDLPGIIREDIFDDVWAGGDDDGSEGPRKIGLHLPTIHEEASRFLRLLPSADRIRLHTDHLGHDYLLVLCRRDLSALKNVPVIFLDASISEIEVKGLSMLLDRDLELVDISVHNPESKVIHDPERTWTKSACEEMVATGDARVRALQAYIEALEGDVGVISHKGNAIVESLISDSIIEEKFTAHYGALRGLNRLEAVDHLVLIGDPSPNFLAYEAEALRWGIDLDDGAAIAFQSGYEGADYRLNYPIVRPLSRAGRFLHKRLIKDELYQALGRARALTHPVTIHAFCAPDVKTPDYEYILNPGTGRSYGDPVRHEDMWRLLLTSWAGASAIARATGASVRRVRDLVKDPDVDAARHAFMDRLFDAGLSVGAVADRMQCSVRTIIRRRKIT